MLGFLNQFFQGSETEHFGRKLLGQALAINVARQAGVGIAHLGSPTPNIAARLRQPLDAVKLRRIERFNQMLVNTHLELLELSLRNVHMFRRCHDSVLRSQAEFITHDNYSLKTNTR